MPVSSYSVIPEIIHQTHFNYPQSVLDVGVGNGMYGALVKNYLPVCRVCGVEGFNYRTAMWNMYDHIWLLELTKALNVIHETFDVIIMADVIEHFDKPDGRAVIEGLKGLLTDRGILLISTPSVFIPQGPVGGNDLEIHKALYTPEDLPDAEVLRDKEGDKYGHYMYVYKIRKA